MILKDFLVKNNVTSFEGVENFLMLSVVVDGTSYFMIDVDTSNIVSGTVLSKFNDFSIDWDNVTVGGITLDGNTTNIICE
jgi:hypothetical protein